MKPYKPIDFYSSSFDFPITIEHPNRLKLALVIMLEMKCNNWYLSDQNYLMTEDHKKVTCRMIKEIVDIPPYTISKILKDIKKSRTLGFSGGVSAREKTLCKLNRLVEIAIEMRNDSFLSEMEWHYFDSDFKQETKRLRLDIEDEEQIDRYCIKNKQTLKKRYGIVELSDWYKNRFPECSRQTMKRDFSVLNEIGLFITYLPETKEYQVQNPWNL